jgi:pyruvate,water dikinase
MGRFRDLLRRLFLRHSIRGTADVEQLRIRFKSRYHSFRLLLEANNKVLEIMADVEQTLLGTRPYGMTYVRAQCTRIATQVWQMIKHLDDLAPKKYAGLHERFRLIREQINEVLDTEPREDEGELVLPLNEIDQDSADQVGDKMARLGELRRRLDLRVPNGFVVTAQGFRTFMEHNQLQTEIDRRVQAAGAERLDDLYDLRTEIQRQIRRAELPGDLQEAILEQYRVLEEEESQGVFVAVRSSSLVEDVAGSSFAGQHHSELNVGEEALLETYKVIVASKYSLPAMTYRLNRGVRDENVVMCVGIMTMVDAAVGGVLYTRNPVLAADDSIIINSSWGLPLGVVEGSGPADHYVVARGESLEIQKRVIAEKRQRTVSRSGDGVMTLDLAADQRSRPSLTDEQIRDLARLGMRLEEYHGAPQDIEWAIDRTGKITLLQCRGLDLLPAPEAAAGETDVQRNAKETVLLQGGVTASPGAAAGPVFAVRRESDALNFPEGAVLITRQPRPLWAPLLGRAAAMVAEHGTMAGHLATVAREFGVPALFGMAGALDRLGNDEVITVDADERTVLRGRVESVLLASTKPVTRRTAASSVHGALSRAARHITPLNLLQPEAPEFSPSNCKTFHDIARFCHERAVQEMFRFGRDHHFPERSSKQLYCDVPMQWWVLNLDDGFTEEIEGKYVRLENIASKPMLAVWAGITAVPWEGPPPLDGRGFVSVMLGATTNAALTTGRQSRYANRNYFMISKNYCYLNSRLGAHFSLIEALVGDRTGENYVSFQFKGGAADYQRRLKRVLFVKEILEEYGFRIEINEDNVIARLEGHESEYMESRLKILGYLNIHTRQLDMIMLNRPSVEYYRKKIHTDLRQILDEE